MQLSTDTLESDDNQGPTFKSYSKTIQNFPVVPWPGLSLKYVPKVESKVKAHKNSMFPDPLIYQHGKQVAQNIVGKYPTKKPLVCPYRKCHTSIAPSWLTKHFRYQHKDVPCIKSVPEVFIALELKPEDISFDGITCITLIDLLDTRFITYDDNTDFSVNPTLALMAIKILSFVKDGIPDEDSSVSSLGSNKSYNFSTVNKILVWLSSNKQVKYNYTLSASSSHTSKRFKYFGPVSSLHERPENICREGRGLILYKNHIVGMSSEKTPILLNVVVHD